MKIVIVTDAWHPQVNGVVRTLDTTGQYLRKLGHEVHYISPQDFKTIPCPTYPQIRLALFPARRVKLILDELLPDAIHIATEGPIGHAAHKYCRSRRLPFTTAFHTQFPEYVRMRAPIPIAWSYAYLRRFHSKAQRTFVPTNSQRDLLEDWRFNNLRVWSRGVETEIFHPEDPVKYELPGPIMIYMGRVAVEKNIEAFLDLKLNGSKVVIGDGPDYDKLVGAYPDVHFVGAKFGRELAQHVAGGDVFVFPSRTDTFGLVMLEAMACGLPVAAYPVQGPTDVVDNGASGVLDENLRRAIEKALTLNSDDCLKHAHCYSWESCTAAFESYLAPIERNHAN
ncbi:MAG: glycosyltransferase family 1 protein [Pseudomonadota bacterium]